MAQAINFQLTETQARNFERLLDDFNETMRRIENNEKVRQEQMETLKAESKMLLGQIREEVEGIKQIRARQNQRKMVWEL